ncbi:MAG: 2-amino-4-hydroxy-6-hydroxymethyldihydropteridine diphosphokinase [Gammaproteobacteria bacterium]|nr:2-amino-4-hydroxy-6-hydroxymethyldihydropteridine diphosphokinase [Gammaproteobacteria bacterium]
MKKSAGVAADAVPPPNRQPPNVLETRNNEVRAYIGLGSNMTDPVAQVHSGFTALGQMALTRIDACSSLYRTAPIGQQDQADFINAVCRVKTRIAPKALMQRLLDIERAHGRVRAGDKGGPRSLDLDLLLYDDELIESAALTVPHPRLHERAFVLYPLFELDPEMLIPGRASVRELMRQCSAQRVQKINS